MSHVLVLGAGPIGTAVTTRLQESGHQVTVVTRSGTRLPGAASVAAPASDPALVRLAEGAGAIVNAINPPYDAWERAWPALHRSIMALAERSGAPLALIGNLYGYPPGVTMTADEPLRPPTRKGAVRVRMWEELLAAHESGRVRAAEIRASDYVGPEALTTPNAHAGRRLVNPVLRGRTGWVVGDPDATHTWTAVDDIAATTVAVIEQSAWGRPWIVPSAPARSIREVAEDVADRGGVRDARVRRIPRTLLTATGAVVPMMRELREMLYQFDAPFVSDGTETTRLLGVEATPWERTIARTVEAARAETSTSPSASATGV